MASGPQNPSMARYIGAAAPAAIGAGVALLASGGWGDGIALGLGLATGAAAGLAFETVQRRRSGGGQAGQGASDSTPDDVAPKIGRDERSAAALRALLNLPTPLVVLDNRGFVMIANDAAEAEIGRKLENRHFAGVFRAPDLVAAVNRAYGENAGSQVSFSMRRVQERHLTARVTPLEENTTPNAGAPRDRARVVISIEDITRIRRAEQLHRDFVANASHELKTPLHAISGFIETIQNAARDDAEARDRFLGLMAQQTERMRDLLQDLLSLNRIELREHVLPEGDVDLKAAVLDAVASARSWDGAKPLKGDPDRERIEVDLPDRLPHVRGDMNELTQLFVNLLTNALKYGGDKRPVQVRATRRTEPRPRIGITVEDYGPGIPREHIPRLTERFYRVNEPVNRGKGGTGLGLAIVKHLIARHRGELEIDSEPGRGSRFTVWLPAAEAAAENPARAPQRL